MRSFTAIILISLLFSVQYARQLNYLECKLINNFKPVTEQCDCEQQSGIEQSGDEQPFHSNHLHINIDEFFMSVKHTVPEHSINICKIKTAHFSLSLTDGFTDPLYAPPEA